MSSTRRALDLQSSPVRAVMRHKRLPSRHKLMRFFTNQQSDVDSQNDQRELNVARAGPDDPYDVDALAK